MIAAGKLARLLVLLGGCAGCAEMPMLPERLMETREAFPTLASTVPPPELRGTSRTLAFDAPFEDVYRAASVSASQAQFVVDDEQKSRGLILASSLFRANAYTGERYPRGHEHKLYFAIAVRELGPKRTEVRIAAKVQAKCSLNPSSLAAVNSTAAEQNATCSALQRGVWSGGKHSAEEEFGRFMTFLRNNLIAAGVI